MTATRNALEIAKIAEIIKKNTDYSMGRLSQNTNVMKTLSSGPYLVDFYIKGIANDPAEVKALGKELANFF